MTKLSNNGTNTPNYNNYGPAAQNEAAGFTNFSINSCTTNSHTNNGPYLANNSNNNGNQDIFNQIVQAQLQNNQFQQDTLQRQMYSSSHLAPQR